MSVVYIALVVFLELFSARAYADTIDKTALDRATREVDRPMVKDEYMWSIRKRPVIKDEMGEDVSNGSDGETAEDYQSGLEESKVYPTYR
jgi:hypothetical protein